MSLWRIAWKSIEHRKLASGLTAFSMSLGVALVVTVLVIYGVISQAFQRGAQGYDLIVGPKGSSLELVLSTVFFNRDPIGTIPYTYYEELDSGRYSPEVDLAIPICMGGYYKGYPVVATMPDFFDKLEYREGRHFQFKEGENFSASDFYSGVIGSEVAAKTGLKVGDSFRMVHGMSATATQDDHDHDPCTITGILAHSGTPNDRALFINIEGFWAMHEHQHSAIDESRRGRAEDDHEHADHEHKGEEEASASNNGDQHSEESDHVHEEDAPAAEDIEHGVQEDHAGHSHGEFDPDHPYAHRRVTAVLVLTAEKETEVTLETDYMGMTTETDGPKKLSEAVYNPRVIALPEWINSELDAQAVHPTRVITDLFNNVVGNIQKVLVILAALVIVVAGIGMMVSIYNSMSERRQEIAIMRALGARRVTVMSIILLESILLSLCGGALGMLIGHTLVGILGPTIAEHTGIAVNAMQFKLSELILIPGLVILASIVGYLPAVIAYRTEVADSLNP